MAEPLYVVLGATGHTGAVVAERLRSAGKRVRAVGRDAGRLKALAARGCEPAAGSADDQEFLRRALAGADAAYALVPPSLAPGIRAFQDRVAAAVAGAVAAAGTRHVVALSSIGADQASGNGPIAGVHRLERRLAETGAAVLALRPGYFYENNLAAIPLVKGMGILGGMLRADLPMAHTATRDIGEVAARRLLALDFSGNEVQELQGPRDLTMQEVATALGKAVGKPDLRYVAFSYEEGTKGLVQAGLPEEMAALYAEMSRGFNEGRLRPTQRRGPATSTPTTIEWFAEQVFAPAYRG